MFPEPKVGRRPVDRGYLLPDEPEGHPLRCVSFLIPDTIEYRAALYRQVYDLGVIETWDRTDPFKAMLASEVWTSALQGSFTVFEDDCPVITQIRPDPSGCGNLEQSTDGGATWEDIPGTDFLPRNGLCAMTGGLEIYPTADEALLTLKGVGAPYQTAKIMRVQDSAGVDVAWINPRGDMTLSGDTSLRALKLLGGGIGLDNAAQLFWKDTGGTYRRTMWSSGTDIRWEQQGGGYAWLNQAQTIIAQVTNAGTYLLQNFTPTTGVSRFQVTAGQGQGGTAPFAVRQNDATEIAVFNSDGKSEHMVNRAETNVVQDAMVFAARSTGTPTTGFGVGMRFRGESSTTNAQEMARLYAAWEDPTHAVRRSRVKLAAYDFSGEKVLIEGGVTGASTPKLGFLGATPQPRLAISGDHRKNTITKQIVELLALFGLCTDNTTDVATVSIVGETQGYDVMVDLLEKLEIYSNGGIVDTTSIGDCLLVCEVPPPETYCKVYDFSDEAVRASWTVERGVEGATGFESTLADEVVFIHTNQFDVFHIIEVTIEYSLSGSSDGSMVMGAYDFTGYTSETWSGIAAGTGQQLTVDFAPSYDAFTGFRLVAVSNDTAQQIIITGLKVLGYDQGSWGMIPNGVDCP